MLKRIGFRYAKRIDPFDGGPHFVAQRSEVSLIQATQRRPVQVADLGVGARRTLLARDLASAPFFRAVAAPARSDGEAVALAPETADALGVAAGDELLTLPL